MSHEIFDLLESRVMSAVENITLLKAELIELKGMNERLGQEIEVERQDRAQLLQENSHLREEQTAWHSKLRMLLDKVDQV